MTKQIIDATNGRLILSDNIIISKSTTKETLISYFGSDNVKIWDVKNGWMHYNIKCLVNSLHFAFTFYFKNDKLIFIDFIPGYIPGKTWDDWTEDDELRSLERYKNWLYEQVGKQTDYNWGTIGAFYDAKGGFSSVVLRYK